MVKPPCSGDFTLQFETRSHPVPLSYHAKFDISGTWFIVDRSGQQSCHKFRIVRKPGRWLSRSEILKISNSLTYVKRTVATWAAISVVRNARENTARVGISIHQFGLRQRVLTKWVLKHQPRGRERDWIRSPGRSGSDRMGRKQTQQQEVQQQKRGVTQLCH